MATTKTICIFLVVLISITSATKKARPESSSDDPDLVFNTQYYGKRIPGDRFLTTGEEIIPSESGRHKINLTNKNFNISRIEFKYSSGDPELPNSNIKVIDGGKGHNYVELEYSSESNRTIVRYEIFGFENEPKNVTTAATVAPGYGERMKIFFKGVDGDTIKRVALGILLVFSIFTSATLFYLCYFVMRRLRLLFY